MADAARFATSVSLRTPSLPVAIFGHSLGSLVSMVVAHRLSSSANGLPACVVLSGFAMDSESPPLGIEALRPLLRVWEGRLISSIVAVLARIVPMMDAVPLDSAWLTSCPEQLRLLQEDALVYHKPWIRNRTAHCLLGLKAQCRTLLPNWGRHFSFLLVHGADDPVCPPSAVDRLMAASPSRDKQCRVYEGLLHEVLFERRAPRERATADVVAFVSSRLAAARGAPPPSKL